MLVSTIHIHDAYIPDACFHDACIHDACDACFMMLVSMMHIYMIIDHDACDACFMMLVSMMHIYMIIDHDAFVYDTHILCCMYLCMILEP